MHFPNPDTTQATGAATVKRLAAGLGLDLLGIARAEPSPYADFFKTWLEDGKHGEMAYLAQHVHARLDPCELLPGARAVICVASGYDDIKEEKQGEDEAAAPRGRVARYAWKPDYHRRMKNALHGLADALREVWPEHVFLTTVDTAPIMERHHAQQAGLGWVGKHTLLIRPGAGSWFMLGEIVTTLPLQSARDQGQSVTDHCGQCTRCIDACPASCISPYSVDASRCVSYLTIEHRDVIPIQQHASIGHWLAGCDICQEVCPHNRHAGLTQVQRDGEAQDSLPQSFSILEVMNWSPEARQKALVRSALKRIKLEQFKRNALIVAGNVLVEQPRHAQAGAMLCHVKKIAASDDEDALVRETARQVLQRVAEADASFAST